MASFLDNTKNFGLMIAIIGVIELVLSILLFVDDMSKLVNIGGIIIGVVYALAGIMVFTQKPGALAPIFPEGITSKFGVLTGYVFLVGVTNVIAGIFTIIGGDLGSGIVSIIVAVIIIAIGWIITNNTKTALDKIIYYILILVFLVLTVLSIISLFGVGELYTGMYVIFGYVEVIATILMFLMAFLYLLDADVKAKF